MREARRIGPSWLYVTLWPEPVRPEPRLRWADGAPQFLVVHLLPGRGWKLYAKLRPWKRTT